MDLIDEEQIAGLKVDQQADDVPRALEGGSTGDAALHAQLLRENQSHGGFAKTRGAIEQDMVQGLSTAEGCLHRNAQHLLQCALPDVLIEALRAQAVLRTDALLIGGGLGIHKHRLPALRGAT